MAMAKLSNFIKLPGGGPGREIQSILQGLERNKTPLRIEIENTNTRFFSVLSIKRGLIVVAKPPGLKDGVTRGGYVRFKVPKADGKELRMEVTVPHFNLLSGNYVFLCKLPTVFAESSQRKHERYNTSRFKNLHLVLPGPQFRFRIVDISREGCKTVTQNVQFEGRLQMGSPYSPATISVGGKVEIGLGAATPRSHHQAMLGFEFNLDSTETSPKYLAHFLQSLEKEESSRMSSSAEQA